MLRLSAAPCAALCVLVGVTTAARRARGQAWDDPRTMALVERATARRAAQLADSTLVDYHATAHGYLTFLAQLGQGFPDPPKVVRADELALQVYWRAPDLSKQIIDGRRDTLLLPTDIRYHRDHLGIVQNNFPDIIRLGEGDEVRDVPHPLSPGGLTTYDFVIRDSLQFRLPDRTLDVYEVAVRPRDPSQPRLVGVIDIDRASAQVVRMAFQFTRAAYLDRELEDISIVLENALVDERYWLPRRQDIEIRRTGTWMNFPARGIIRGRWAICCYQINVALSPDLFRGPEIVALPERLTRAYHWTGRVLDSLPPDAAAATPADVARVRAEVRALVSDQVLARGAGAGPAAHRISDFARVDRVEGLALGGGGAAHAGDLVAAATARYGTADGKLKARVSLGVTHPDGGGARLFASHDFRDAGDVAEGSMLVNSLAAQEFGTDRSDPYDAWAAGLEAGSGDTGAGGLRWALALSYEQQQRLRVHATPWHGAFEPTLPAWPIREERLAFDLDRPAAAAWFGTTLHVHAQLRAGAFSPWRDTVFTAGGQYFGRAFAELDADRPVGDDRLVTRTTVAAVTATHGVPAQEYVFLGGPVTGPGYAYHEFAARVGASEHVEWQVHIPFAPLSLGAFGRAPPSATLAPYAHVVYVADGAPFAAPARGWYPSVGVGVLMLFDLVRVDVARGLRSDRDGVGGRWTFSLDLTPALWRVL